LFAAPRSGGKLSGQTVAQGALLLHVRPGASTRSEFLKLKRSGRVLRFRPANAGGMLESIRSADHDN